MWVRTTGSKLHREAIGNGWRLSKAVITAATFSAGLWLFHWSLSAAFFLSLLVASVSGLIDGKVSIVLGLLCLVSCPILLFAEKRAVLEQSPLVNYYAYNMGILSFKSLVDQLAIWAYYLLCIGILALIIQHARKRQTV